MCVCTFVGPIGLVCLMVAKACGASVLIATGIEREKREREREP